MWESQSIFLETGRDAAGLSDPERATLPATSSLAVEGVCGPLGVRLPPAPTRTPGTKERSDNSGMRVPRMGVAVLAGVALAACARLTPASAVSPTSTEQSTSDLAASATLTPSPSPSYRPGPDSTGGTVARRTAISVVLSSAGTETEIDLRSVVDVWRETSVPVSAIEIGDELMVNGTRGASSFVARYVW